MPDLVPDWLWQYVLRHEGGGPDSISSAGAIGPAQVMSGTAAGFGVSREELFDPQTNLDVGHRYLQQLWEKYKNPALAAAAYNVGPGRVDAVLAGKQKLPLETQKYIAPLQVGGMQPGTAWGQYLPQDAPADLEGIRQKALSLLGEPAQAPTYNINLGGQSGPDPRQERWLQMQRMSQLLQFAQQGTHRLEPIDYDPWAIAKLGHIDA